MRWRLSVGPEFHSALLLLTAETAAQLATSLRANGEGDAAAAEQAEGEALCGYKSAALEAAKHATAARGVEGGAALHGRSALQWARYCDRLLRDRDAEKGPAAAGKKGSKAQKGKRAPSGGELASDRLVLIVVQQTLRALAAGHAAASAMVPRVLELIRAHPECRDAFVEEAANVPEWRFLQWTSQCMARR